MSRRATSWLMEEAFNDKNAEAARRNLHRGLRRERSREALDTWFVESWPLVRTRLLDGAYRPAPPTRAQIFKYDGTSRTLHVPSIPDRFIQRALLQVMGWRFERLFSDSSFAYRRHQGTHDAIRRIKTNAYRLPWVLDLDIKGYFDHIEHGRLINELMRHIGDERVLGLIWRYLKASTPDHGLTHLGVPQGAPLSPLLANLYLNAFDRFLHARDIEFVRYADDVKCFTWSLTESRRILRLSEDFLRDRLNLELNSKKSAIDLSGNRPFLGYAFHTTSDLRLVVAPRSIQAFKRKVRELLGELQERPQRARAIVRKVGTYLRGWMQYFSLTEIGDIQLAQQWTIRAIRAACWRAWRTGKARFYWLVKLGLSKDVARRVVWNTKSSWWNASAPHMKAALSYSTLQTWGFPILRSDL